MAVGLGRGVKIAGGKDVDDGEGLGVVVWKIGSVALGAGEAVCVGWGMAVLQAVNPAISKPIHKYCQWRICMAGIIPGCR